MGTSTRYFFALFFLIYGSVADSFVPLAQQWRSHGTHHQRQMHLLTSHTSRASQWRAAKSRSENNLVLSAQSTDVVISVGGDGNSEHHTETHDTNSDWQHYFSMMRPITIIQAVGAFLVGRLVIVSQQSVDQPLMPIIAASLSIYLSYGAGMAMNDCADAGVDALHAEKSKRSIASNTISVRKGWAFCFGISVLSMALARLADRTCGAGPRMATGGFGFATWTSLNLALMASYALGMQKIFLVKNVLCGFFAISPLLGASLLDGAPSRGSGGAVASSLYRLAAVGFPLQVSREILKDVEDVETDRGVKRTLPLAIGGENSRRIAYGLVAAVNGTMLLSPYYWRMFASRPPVYAISVAVGTPMCVAASRLPLSKGQRLLKKSIYVLLSGMISGLLIQSLS